MATDFDQWPIYEKLVKPNGMISDNWSNSMTAFIQNLGLYLKSFGMFIPQLTQTQINSIQSPVNGQLVYNTTTNTAQYYKNGTWTSF